MALLLVAVFVALPSGAEEPAARSSLEEATAIAAELALQRENPMVAALLKVDNARRDLASISAPPGSEDYHAAAGRYADSLLALRWHPHPDTVVELGLAVRHADDQVRLAALSAMREGAADGKSLILGEVGALITNDPNPAIRREAFEVYCRWGDQGHVLSLAVSLGRAPGPVQDLAVREWIRIEKENLDRANGDTQAQPWGGGQ